MVSSPQEGVREWLPHFLWSILPSDDDMKAQVWHDTLLGVACLNLVLMCVLWYKIDPKDRYGSLMKWLCVPWCVECAWRSVFPSLYLERVAWYDTQLNSILVDRCLACVGELCWTGQIALALQRQNAAVESRLVTAAAYFAVVCYVVAEGASFYNVATTNELSSAARKAPSHFEEGMELDPSVRPSTI